MVLSEEKIQIGVLDRNHPIVTVLLFKCRVNHHDAWGIAGVWCLNFNTWAAFSPLTAHWMLTQDIG